MSLRDFEQLIYRCSKCGACRFSKKKGEHGPYTLTCPSGLYFQFESYWPSGKNDIARGLLDGTLQWSESLLKRIYTCTTCGACDVLCYEATGKRVLPVIMELRSELVKRKIGPLPSLKEAHTSIKKNYNPYKKPHEMRSKWLNEKIADKADIIYFTGCTSSYIQQETAVATMGILKSAGVEFGTLADEWCCGYPSLQFGYTPHARGIAKRNLEAIKRSGAEMLLCNCPECYQMIKHHYPILLDCDLPFQALHTTEYFRDMVRDGSVTPVKEIPWTVVYHDPCKLGRFSRIYEAPREILKSIPGIVLNEMERTREFAWCCGGDCTTSFAFPEFSSWVAQERVHEAQTSEADILVSACPRCKHAFHETSHLSPSASLKFMDLSEILALSLGINIEWRI